MPRQHKNLMEYFNEYTDELLGIEEAYTMLPHILSNVLRGKRGSIALSSISQGSPTTSKTSQNKLLGIRRARRFTDVPCFAWAEKANRTTEIQGEGA